METANTAKTVVARVQDRALIARTSQTIQHILDRAPSIQTTADGDATQHTFTVVANATAAPTSHAAPTSTARDHVTTRRATATSATAARPTVPRVSTVAAAAAPVLAHVPDAPTSPHTPHILGRAR